jgi:hypothetical protein
MIEPEITRDVDWATDDAIYRLRIPKVWLVQTRWPRIALSWWLLRLVWTRPRPPVASPEEKL